MMKIVYGGNTWELSHSRYLEVPWTAKPDANPEDYTSGDHLAWPNWAHKVDGSEISFSPAVTYLNSVYTYTAGYNLETVGNGAKISIMVGHADAQGDIKTDGITTLGNYAHKVKFEQEFTVDGEGEIITPPPPVEYPVDPEPTEGPENTDLKIVLTDLAKMPLANESSWANVQKYDMIAKNGNSEGATGTVQVVTCDGNLIFRVEIHDDTIAWGRDSRWIQFGNEDLGIVTRGNYDTAEGVTGWLDHKKNDFG